MFIKNQKGVALVYVLMALVAVGAIGMLVLNMARKEMSDTMLRSTTETARFSCNAGLTHGVNFFTNENNSAARDIILNTWYRNFLLGNSPNTVVDPDMIWVPNGTIAGQFSNPNQTDSMQFRVRIVNIDFSEVRQITEPRIAGDNASGRVLRNNRIPENSPFTILLNAESIDATGSRSNCLGSYRIVGFELGGGGLIDDTTITTVPDTTWNYTFDINEIFDSIKTGIYDSNWIPDPEKIVPTHALFLGGGSILINCKVDITGATYIGGKNSSSPAIQHTQMSPGSDQISHYRGEFRLYGGGPTPLLANERFHGPAYFEGGTVDFSFYSLFPAESWFHKGWGGSDVTFTYSSYNNPHTLTPAVMKTRTDGIENLAAFHNVTTDVSKIKRESNTRIENVSNKVDVFQRLGIDPDEPTAFDIVLPTGITQKRYTLPVTGAGAITANTLNGYLTNASIPKYIDSDGNSWLVLETSADAQFGSGGTFTGNAIIINKHNASGNSLFNVANGSAVLFYIPSDVSLSNVNYGATTGTFNGLFYNGSKTTRLTLGATSAGWYINGAFYNIGNRGDAGNNAEIWIGANGFNGPVTIDFNSAPAISAITKISKLGVLVRPCDEPPCSGSGNGHWNYYGHRDTTIYDFVGFDTTNWDSSAVLPIGERDDTTFGRRPDPATAGLERITEDILPSVTTKLESRSF